IGRVNEQIVRFLMDKGWIEGERIAIDGTKLKAYTGWDMPDEEALEERLQRAYRRLDGWLGELQANDTLEDLDELEDREQDWPGTESECMARIQRLRRRIQKLEEARRRLADS